MKVALYKARIAHASMPGSESRGFNPNTSKAKFWAVLDSVGSPFPV